MLSSKILMHFYYQVQAHTAHHITGQLTERQIVGDRNNDFIQKARRLRGWCASVSKNHFARVRIQVSFMQS